jgi:hypothetical protein
MTPQIDLTQVHEHWAKLTDAERAAWTAKCEKRIAAVEAEMLLLYETRGAMLDTAAQMNPVPDYITSGIAEVTDEINLLTAAPIAQ